MNPERKAHDDDARPDDGLLRLLALAVSDDVTIAERRLVDEALRYSAAARAELAGYAACTEALAAAGAATGPTDARPSLWSRIEPQLGPAGRRRPPRAVPWMTMPRLGWACAALAAAHAGLSAWPAGRVRDPGMALAQAAPAVSTPGLVAGAAEFLDPSDAGGVLRQQFGAMVTRTPEGLRIHAVFEDGDFHRAGLRPGDVILQVGRRPVRSTDEFKGMALARGLEQPLRALVRRGQQAFFVDVPLSMRARFGRDEIDLRVLPVDPSRAP